METLSIQEVLTDEAGNPFKMHDGQYLCAVISENAVVNTSSISEETLLSLGLISPQKLDESLSCNDEAENFDVGDASNEEGTAIKAWSDAATRLVLDKYSEYLPLVGPMKTFDSKKIMWQRIAEDLKKIKICRTATQVENRWKTVLKRKKKSSQNNHTSGSKRQKVEFEEELARIAAIDDSLEPEVMRSAQKYIINKKDKPAEASGSGSEIQILHKNKNRRVMSLPKMFQECHKEKEENKQKRHEEKMEFLKQFATVIQTTAEKKN